MPRLRWIRLLGVSVATGMLTAAAVLGWAVAPASAASPGLCPLLPALCPPAAPATTKPAPTTTAPPKTAPPTTARAPASTPATAPRTTTASGNASAVSSVGDGVLPASIAGGPAGSTDDAAPQLAGLPTSSTTLVTIAPPALSGLVGATSGLPNDHSTLRVALSILVLLVAVVATAQLPASRRAPRPIREPLG